MVGQSHAHRITPRGASRYSPRLNNPTQVLVIGLKSVKESPTEAGLFW